MISKKQLTSLLWLLGEHGTAILSGLVVTIVLARALGASDFGIISACLAFTALFVPFFQVGLNGLLVKEIRDRDTDKFVLINGLSLRILFTVFFSCLAILISLFVPSINEHILLIAILLIGQIGLSGSISEQWFHARKTFRHYAIIRSAVLITGAFFKCVFAVLDGQIISIIIIYSAENIVLGAVSWLAFIRKVDPIPAKIDLLYKHQLLKKGGWLIFSSLAAMIYLKIDQVMIFSFLGEEQSGIYAVAAKVAEVAYFLPTIVVAVLFPYLIDIHKEDESVFRQMVRPYFSALFYLSCVICIACFLIVPVLIPWLFGAEYDPAVAVISVYIWAAIFVFMRALVSRIIIIEDILPLSLISHSVGACLNVALNLWLIPCFGIIGAAYATLLAYAGGAFLVFFVFRRSRWFAIAMLGAPIWPLQRLFK